MARQPNTWLAVNHPIRAIGFIELTTFEEPATSA